MASIIQKKRLANEVKLLSQQPLHYCTAYPDASDPLIWYFLIKGQKGTDYHSCQKGGEGGCGGEYIGKIVHSPKYPAEPPDYYMLTPSGRYDIGKKICLTNSSYHKGDWSSTWNILSILIAFYSIWLDDKEHGISHITDTSVNRKKMADSSIAYNLKNNAAIYSKFDRTNLKDDAPVTLKKKVVSETDTITEKIIPEQNQPVEHIFQMKEMKEVKEMKVVKEIKQEEPVKKAVNNIVVEEPVVKKVKKTTKKA
jgi:ubiquitin-conjugating enzyme E2 J2